MHGAAIDARSLERANQTHAQGHGDYMMLGAHVLWVAVSTHVGVHFCLHACTFIQNAGALAEALGCYNVGMHFHSFWRWAGPPFDSS